MTIDAKAKYAVLALLCTAASGLLLQCCSDPVGPQPVAKNYYFYADDYASPYLLRFAPSSGVLDTVGYREYTDLMDVSSDGALLYLVNLGNVSVYSPESHGTVHTFSYPGGKTAISSDGKYVALLESGGERPGVRVFQLPTYSLIYSDDSSCPAGGAFSSNNRSLYFVDWTDPQASKMNVVRLNIDSSFRSTRRSIPSMPGLIIQMAPSVDERLWFLYSRRGWDDCSFGVYDVAKDSLIYLANFAPGGGWLVVSPDGKNVFFTNPGTLLVGTPPPSAFYVYDIPTNTVKEVSTKGLAADSAVNGDRMSVGPIAISPDGKTLVAVRGVDGRDILIFDVPRQTITNYFYFHEKAWFADVKCQAGK